MIPERIQAALDRYVSDHLPTGSFLRAVLEDDIYCAARYADADSLKNLVDIVMLVREQPAECHGSPDKVAAWLARRE